MKLVLESIKVVFVGPSGVGKTTLRQIFFEQASPLKLLTTALEPTVGLDTTIYDLGSNIAVHDLAGQQLAQWLNDPEPFYATDLVLLVLDAQEEWEINVQLYRQVSTLRKKVCPEAWVVVLFHKIDLLAPLDRRHLEMRTDAVFHEEYGTTVIATSITREFFMSTFREFVAVLRAALLQLNLVNASSLFQRVEIFEHFTRHDVLPLKDLVDSIVTTLISRRSDGPSDLSANPREIARNILNGMHAKKYLIVDEINHQVRLGKRGRSVLNNLQNHLHLKSTEEILFESATIRGFLLADESGRPLCTYEHAPGFFSQLEPGAEGGPDPSLIASFFSAIGAFAQGLNRGGISTINLSGSDVQIVSQTHENLVGIFFISWVPVNQATVEILRQYLEELSLEFHKELDIFQKRGNVAPFKERMSEVLTSLEGLDRLLQRHALEDTPLTQDRLLDIYQRVDRVSLPAEITTEIKTLIFHYAVTQDANTLAKVDELLDTHDVHIP